MAESHPDSEDGELEEIADVYVSSSYSPSTDERDSDSDSSSYKNTRNISNCNKRSSPKNIEAPNSVDVENTRNISNCNKRSSPKNIEAPNSVDVGPVQKYLDVLGEIKYSSDVESEFLKFCQNFVATHFEPTPEQRKNAKMLDIEIDETNYVQDKTYNRFTKQDASTIIGENWNCFCEDYGFDPKKDLKLFYFGKGIKSVLSGKQRVLFKRYLSLHLPYRPENVYLYFLIKVYYGRCKEKFTAEEDELLALWYEISERTTDPFGLSILSVILQRPPKSLKKRWTFLHADCRDEPIAVKSKNSSQPLRYLDDILSTQDNEYPDWTMNELVWKEIAEIDGQSSVQHIKKTYFQELYPSAKAKSKVGSAHFKLHLIKRISLLEQPTWETVDWKELGKDCFNVGAVRVYSVIRALVRNHVPAEKWGDLNAALKMIREYSRLPDQSNRMVLRGRALDVTHKEDVSDLQDNVFRIPGYLDDILTRQTDDYPDWTMNEQVWKEIAEIDGQSSVQHIKKTYFQELYPSAKAKSKVGSAHFKLHLINRISLLEQPTWETVDWKELGKDCFNVGAVRVYSVIRALVRNHVPAEKWGDLNAALKMIREYSRLPDQSNRMVLRGRALAVTHKEDVSDLQDNVFRIPGYLDDILTRQTDDYPDWIMNEQVWKEMVDIDGQSSVQHIKKTYFRELCPSAKSSMRLSSDRFKLHLVQQISLLEQPTWETVDWKELGKDCFNAGAVRVYSVVRTLVRNHVPPEKWGDLDAALTTIREYYRLPTVPRKSGGQETDNEEPQQSHSRHSPETKQAELNESNAYIININSKPQVLQDGEECLDGGDADTAESSVVKSSWNLRLRSAGKRNFKSS